MLSPLVLHRILLDGLVLSLVGSALILAGFKANPRYWLHDYPKAIQDAVPRKTPAEKRDARVWTVPFMLSLLVGIAVSGLLLKRQMPDARFLTVYADTLGVALFFNLWDLLILDWLVFCTITPAFMVLPGTAGMPEYKHYGHHVVAFVTGAISSVVIAAIIAGLVYAFG